jgi:HEAT repeat protein
MHDDSLRTIEALLASTEPEEVRKGLQLLKEEICRVGSEEARPLFEMLTTIFYVDPLDRPDLVPVLEEAISLVVGFGEWVIPVLVRKLDSGDLKAQMASAHALGRIGADAIAPLMAEYHSSPDPALRAFVLYALGKIKSPKIVRAAHLALEAAESPDRELRDTATRAIGKFAESIPPGQLPEEIRRGFIEKLQKNLAEQNSGIRAKAVRSLGKLARYGHLTPEERQKLKATLSHILGKDEHFDWDRAYVVRKEAEEALQYV